MVLIIGIAGAAALAVLLYNHLREQQPELATLSTRRAQQLAAVVLVLSKAVDGVIDALALGLRPAVASSAPRGGGSGWSTSTGTTRRTTMPGRRDHLQLVGGRRLRVRPQPRMQVATQAIFAGPQDHRVFAMTPQASGRGYGHIAVRVGRVLVYLEDRQALEAWTTAIGKAADLADAAFGPDLPASRYQPPGGRK